MATDWLGRATSYAARNFGSNADPSHLIEAYLSGAIDVMVECRERDRAELQRLQGRGVAPPAAPASADGGSAGHGGHRPFRTMAFKLVDAPVPEAA